MEIVVGLRSYRLTSLVIAVIGLACAAYAFTLPLGSLNNPGAGVWPLVLGVTLTVAALLLFFFEKTGEDYEPLTKRSWIILAAFGVMAGFAFLFSMVGLTIPSLLLCIVWMKFFAHESWLTSIGLGVLFTAVFVAVFGVLLRVPMPSDPVLNVILEAVR